MADDLRKGPASSSMAAATGLVAERAARLERQLAERDQLVQALTDQLELAAEQLDRMQRSGAADRRRGGGGGSNLPADVVADHRQMLEDMQRVVQQWEDMQAGLVLGRIEGHVIELRDFVADRLTPGAAISGSPRAPRPEPTPAAAVEAAQSAGDEINSSSVWETLKAEMLSDGSSPAAAPVPGLVGLGPTRPLEPIQVADPPKNVNLNASTPDELAEAVMERDAYICYLLQLLRTRTEVAVPPDWSVLNNAPAELVVQLEHMSAELQDNLRRADVEISIERARLAREQAQLTLREEQLKRQMRDLGIEQEAIANDKRTGVPGKPGGSSDRRWSRFLGINRET